MKTDSLKAHHYLILIGAFIIFLWVLVPQASKSAFYYENHIDLQEAQMVAADPLAAWQLNLRDRRHPVIVYILFLEQLFFGSKVIGYFIVVYLFHFFSALLVCQICFKLFGNQLAALLSGLLFLFFSGHQALIGITTNLQVGLMFMLLAVLTWMSFLHHRKNSLFLITVLFQTLAILSYEGGVVFPAVALLLVPFVKPMSIKPMTIFLYCVPILFVLDFVVCFLLLSDFANSDQVTIWFSKLDMDLILSKIRSTIEVLIRPLLMPEKGYLPPTKIPENGLRLLPALIIFISGFIFLFKQDRLRLWYRNIPKASIFLSIGWIIITISPYVFYPLSFEHVPRFLYYPSVGFAIVIGIGASHFFQICRIQKSRTGMTLGAAVLVYVLILNAFTNVYHLQRYKTYTLEYPESDYTERVKELFHGR